MRKLTDGQITRPYGPSLRANGRRFSCSRQNMRIGSTNTIVLPEPVNAMPIISRPDRLQHSPIYCMQWVSKKSIVYLAPIQNGINTKINMHHFNDQFPHKSVCKFPSQPSHLCILCGFAFSALTLLVGHQEEHPACKNWVMRCWCGYLSATRCWLFATANGPAKATASQNPTISCII